MNTHILQKEQAKTENLISHLFAHSHNTTSLAENLGIIFDSESIFEAQIQNNTKVAFYCYKNISK